MSHPLSPRVIDRVIEEFHRLYPEHMEHVVDPYLQQLTPSVPSPSTAFFTLLVGETQSGKTIAMHLLSWILIHVYGRVPCFVTKKISPLRVDALHKLEHGTVNQIVKRVCVELLHPQLASSFQLSGVVGLRTNASSYQVGQIPIFLMQPENNVQLLKWMKGMKGMTGKPIFFFDEVHELYATGEYLETRGFTMEQLATAKVGNHVLMHKIANCCRENGMAMIGITATPQRVLCSDPEVYPSIVYRLPCVAPKTGLKRVGYDDSRTGFVGAEFHGAQLDSEGLIEVVNQILERPPVVLSTGQKQVKFLNITTNHYNESMLATHELLTSTFSEDQVHVRVFMQTSRSSSLRSLINVEELDQFFDLGTVPASVIQSGVMILIGKSREAAGITIKPSFKLEAQERHIYRSTQGSEYIINGITDLCIRLPNNMETADQLLGRASGWYDSHHQTHIWLPTEQLQDAQRNIQLTKQGMLDQYDGMVGPRSVLRVQNSCSSIQKFSSNNEYTQRGAVKVTLSDQPPEGEALQLKTIVVSLDDSIWQSYKAAKLLPQGGKSAAGRRVHHQIKEVMRQTVGYSERLQVAWEQRRGKEIRVAAVQPKDNDQWRVNAYVYPDSEGLKLVCFEESWDERSSFGYKCEECLTGECCSHQPDTKIWWYDGNQYNIASFTLQSTHKSAEILKTWQLSDGHRQVLERVDALVGDSGWTKPAAYPLFVRLHTALGYNRLRPKDIAHQTWMSQQWRLFKGLWGELVPQVNEVITLATSERQLMQEVTALLRPYFSMLDRPVKLVLKRTAAGPVPVPTKLRLKRYVGAELPSYAEAISDAPPPYTA